MVKTRNQNKQKEQKEQTQYKKSEECITTRSGYKLNRLERVELPVVKVPKVMKRRAQIKKEIAKKSWKKQIDKKCKRFERLEYDFLKHKYYNVGEMTTIWKNFEMIFSDIDKFRTFQKRVEGK